MNKLTQFPRLFLAAIFALILSSCGPTELIEANPDPLGDFKLGFVVVVAKNVEEVEMSRKVTKDQLINSLKPKLESTFAVFEGDHFYHIAVSFDGYILSPPGIPLVMSPKSGLVISVDIWDDAKGAKITEEPKQFTIVEQSSGKTFVGSGLSQTKEEQLDSLTDSAVREILKWLRENENMFDASAESSNDT